MYSINKVEFLATITKVGFMEKHLAMA